MQYNIMATQNDRIHSVQNQYLGYIRILHAVPDAPNVDVYANEILIANSLSYSEITAYLPILEGAYIISIYQAGTSRDPILTTILEIKTGDILTASLAGTLGTICFLTIPDYTDPAPMRINESKLRFINFSPNAPALNVTLPDGTMIFGDVTFKEHTEYRAVSAGNYILQIRDSRTSTILLTVPNIILESKAVYSIFAIGLVEGNPSLAVLFVLDGFFI